MHQLQCSFLGNVLCHAHICICCCKTFFFFSSETRCSWRCVLLLSCVIHLMQTVNVMIFQDQHTTPFIVIITLTLYLMNCYTSHRHVLLSPLFLPLLLIFSSFPVSFLSWFLLYFDNLSFFNSYLFTYVSLICSFLGFKKLSFRTLKKSLSCPPPACCQQILQFHLHTSSVTETSTESQNWLKPLALDVLNQQFILSILVTTSYLSQSSQWYKSYCLPL